MNDENTNEFEDSKLEDIILNVLYENRGIKKPKISGWINKQLPNKLNHRRLTFILDNLEEKKLIRSVRGESYKGIDGKRKQGDKVYNISVSGQEYLNGSSNKNKELSNNKPTDAFDNLLIKIKKYDIDEIEKSYLIEGCLCGKNELILAATTMLGCAAERVIVQIAEAYMQYLKNNATPKEQGNFKKDVIDAKKANQRLDNLMKRIENKEKMFMKLGLEKSKLHFSFFDIVRQNRNDSGHPTGVKLDRESLVSMYAQYVILFDKIHYIIKELPNHKEFR